MARDVDPVRTVSQIDYEWIELRDGARLAPCISLPDDVAADPEGDHHAHEHRRPLCRRRALQGRLPIGHRSAALELVHVPLAVPAAAPARGRRRLARSLAPPAGEQRALGPHLARAPAPRRLLETRLRVRGLRRHRGAGVRGRGLGRRLHQRRAAAPRRPQRTSQGPHRPVGARLPPLRGARTGHRLPAGVLALVGPLAQGPEHGRHGRADASRVDAGVHGAEWARGRQARTLGGRTPLAIACASPSHPPTGRSPGRRPSRSN